MPQASDEDRERAVELFGSIDAGVILRYLEDLGWIYDWDIYDFVFPGRDVTGDELFAVRFLINEWDF